MLFDCQIDYDYRISNVVKRLSQSSNETLFNLIITLSERMQVHTVTNVGIETYFSFNNMPQTVKETRHSIEEGWIKNEMHSIVLIFDM